jgi:ElaB/YqjD/DUF883 family membrane-anchored ribosome-binding protein
MTARRRNVSKGPQAAVGRLEENIMAEDTARKQASGEDQADELAELRQATTELLRKFKAYGLDRLGVVRDEVEEDSQVLAREGRRMARDLRKTLGEVEAKVERHVRDHPVTWIGGLLGAIGFGLILGVLLRRRD